MSILIINGRIITATDDYVADIFIEGETISAIGKNLNVTADEVIRLRGGGGACAVGSGLGPVALLDRAV